jgi:hypothetical protein
MTTSNRRSKFLAQGAKNKEARLQTRRTMVSAASDLLASVNLDVTSLDLGLDLGGTERNRNGNRNRNWADR